jgi:RecJ-like exonuclease
MAKKKRIAAKRNTLVKKKVTATKKKAAVKKKKTARKAAVSARPVLHRLVIHTDDISIVLGINIRTAQRLLQTIRETLGRRKNEYVSIKEFADYVHLKEEDVKRTLSETILS